jgi:hypothetical protein
LIVWIRDHDWTVFYAGGTTRAFVLNNISGLLNQGCLKVSCFSFYSINFSEGQDLYVGMPADLDQFGSEYSHGAVIGGIGLVKLGHMAAYGRGFLNKVNLETGRGQIKRGLDTTDPPTHNHDVSKVTICHAFVNLF